MATSNVPNGAASRKAGASETAFSKAYREKFCECGNPMSSGMLLSTCCKCGAKYHVACTLKQGNAGVPAPRLPASQRGQWVCIKCATSSMPVAAGSNGPQRMDEQLIGDPSGTTTPTLPNGEQEKLPLLSMPRFLRSGEELVIVEDNSPVDSGMNAVSQPASSEAMEETAEPSTPSVSAGGQSSFFVVPMFRDRASGNSSDTEDQENVEDGVSSAVPAVPPYQAFLRDQEPGIPPQRRQLKRGQAAANEGRNKKRPGRPRCSAPKKAKASGTRSPTAAAAKRDGRTSSDTLGSGTGSPTAAPEQGAQKPSGTMMAFGTGSPTATVP
jgi:hypothetical protein